MESCKNDFLSTLGEDLQTTSCALLRLAVISVASYSKIIDYLGSKFLWLNHKNMAFSLILAVRHGYFIVHNKLSLCNLCKVKKSLPYLIQVRNKFSPQFHWPKNDEDLAQNSTKV